MSEATPRPPRPPVMRFLLICPGETEDQSFIPDFSGHSDPGLSATGRHQAEAMAAALTSEAGADMAALYCSPLASAQTTATLLSEALGLPAPQVSGTLSTIWPESLPGGSAGREAFELIQERAWSLVETLRERHGPEAVVALVSHGLPIRALICRALAIPLEESDRFRVEPGSLSSIEFRGQRTILSSLNDICHLE